MEKTIDQHISQLLYKHECVIVPEFGAFITRDHSAEINQATHMMRPPSKRVSFNKHITQNDGLLANFVARTEKVSYSAALDGIAVSVRSWNRMLKSGKKIILEGVGRLYLDDQGKIQFNPQIDLNYNRGFYGLSIFRAELISREVEIQKGIEKVISSAAPKKERKAKSTKVRSIAPTAGDKKRSRRGLGWAAVLGPVAALLIAGSFYQNSLEDELNGYANINPFKGFRLFEHKPVTQTSNEGVKEEVKTISFQEAEQLTQNAIEETPIKAEVETSVKAFDKEVAKPFKIVVGSFKDQVNAQEFIDELTAKGYDAFMADGDTRYNRVAVQRFATRAEADVALQNIKQEINPGAWVYKY